MNGLFCCGAEEEGGPILLLNSAALALFVGEGNRSPAERYERALFVAPAPLDIALSKLPPCKPNPLLRDRSMRSFLACCSCCSCLDFAKRSLNEETGRVVS